MTEFQRPGPSPSFEVGYAPARSSRPMVEATPAEKAARAEQLARVLDEQAQLVREDVAAAQSAATAHDLADWADARADATEGVRQLREQVKRAPAALRDVTDAQARAQLEAAPQILAEVETLVASCPAPHGGPVLRCRAAVFSALPTRRLSWAEEHDVLRAVVQIFETQATRGDVAAFEAIVHRQPDDELTHRFRQLSETRRRMLLRSLRDHELEASAGTRQARRRKARHDAARARRAAEASATDPSGVTNEGAEAPRSAESPASAVERPRSIGLTRADAQPDAAVTGDDAPQTLPPPIRGELELATGRSLGRVRLHAGPHGDAVAQTHGARAVAIGSDIHMAAGQLAQERPEGRELLAHEVAHTVQAEAHGGQAQAAAKRDGDPTEAAEIEADAFAARFRERGSAVRWTPSVSIGQTAPMRAPQAAKAAAAASPAADPGPQSAAVYFADNQARFFAAIRSRLAAVALPPPHQRLVWGTDGLAHGIAFERAMVGAYGTDMDLALALPALIYPVDPFQVIDLHRDLSSGRPGERTDRQPALGTLAWNPVVGQAFALEIEACLRRSLPRMGLRYVAQADDYHGQLAPDQLVTSHPFDRVVARLLCDPAVARFVPAHGKPSKHADTAAPAAFKDGIRLVTFEWVREPKLWNWVRVIEPADARAEEVAASVFERGDGQNHTEYAYALTPAPPYFQIPPPWARRFPAAAEHAPPDDADDGAQARSALALADSPLADDTARAQAGKPVAKLDIAGLAHTLDRSDLQLQLAAERLADWRLNYLIGPAQRWIRRHKDVVRAAPDETLRVWAAIAAAQSATLTDAMGDLIEVAGLARSARVDPGTPEARPFRDVIEALGIAMGESHLAQTATAQLAAARQHKAMLPLTLLDRTMRESHDAAQELAATEQVPISEADHTDPRQVAAATNRTLESGTLALREKALTTGAINATELEAVTVAASEETLRTRILTLYGKLTQLLDASDQATEGFFGHVGNVRNADIWNLRTELVTIRPLAWNILETMRREAIPPQPIPQDPALARAAFAQARKQAVANAQMSFARLTEDRQLQTLFPRALGTLSDAQKNTAYFKLACEIAALIGVSIAGSVAGAMVGGLVRGALLADAATDAAVFARTATAARWAGAAANVATDAAVQSAVQTSVFGGNTKLTFIENVMTNLMTLGALRPFHALTGELGKLDRNATGLWKVASGGKVVLAEAGKLTIETLVAAGAAYVSARLVEGQPPPSQDVAVSWAMQGAAMAVGKFVHGRMQELTARWGKLAEQKIQLIKRARAQEALARQVEHSGSTESALQLLEEHARLLQDEHALLQDPAAVARLGLDETQLGVLRAGNDAALTDTHSQSFEIMRLRFHGLDPIAGNGLVWSGTRAQIEAALGEVGAVAVQTQVGGQDRWTAHIAGREITFVETQPPITRATTTGKAGPEGVQQLSRADIPGQLAEHRARGARIRPLDGDPTGGRRYEIEYPDGRRLEIVETSSPPDRPGAGGPPPTPEQAARARAAADHAAAVQAQRDEHFTARNRRHAGTIIADTIIGGAGQTGTQANAAWHGAGRPAPGIDVDGVPAIFNIAPQGSMFSHHGDFPIGQAPGELRGPAAVRQPGEFTPSHDTPIGADDFVRSLVTTGYESGMVTHKATVARVDVRPADGWGDGAPAAARDREVRLTADDGTVFYAHHYVSATGLGPARPIGLPNEAALASAGRLVYAQDSLTLPAGARTVLVVGDGASGAWACEAAIKVGGATKVYWAGGGPKAGELPEPVKAALTAIGLTPGQMAIFGRAYNARNAPTFKYIENGTIELRTGLSGAELEPTSNHVRATLGIDTVEIDGIIVATGQRFTLPEGMSVQSMQFRMVTVEYNGKERVVALDAVDANDGHPLGIRMVGAQMAQLARPENEKWVVSDERVRFKQMVLDQSSDGDVPADSRGVPGSIYQTNIDVPLAMEQPVQ